MIEARIAERAAAKKAKDFTLSDAIRAELDAMGIELRDTPQGTTWVMKA
jgi:cysteinyl-tRNA synthetase